MSKNLTISQLAKELNVSRQKIYRFIDKQENIFFQQYIYINSKKIKMINAEGVRHIKENISRTDGGQSTDNGRTEEKNSKDVIETVINRGKGTEKRTDSGQGVDSGRTFFFMKQIEQKDIQIYTLQKIIEKNQSLLDQQQRLSLQDKMLMEEYKSEINELKALKMPSQETQVNQLQKELEILRNESKTLQEQLTEKEGVLKKWWEFWKY